MCIRDRISPVKNHSNPSNNEVFPLPFFPYTQTKSAGSPFELLKFISFFPEDVYKRQGYAYRIFQRTMSDL